MMNRGAGSFLPPSQSLKFALTRLIVFLWAPIRKNEVIVGRFWYRTLRPATILTWLDRTGRSDWRIMYVASIYFHGEYRPAYFQAETLTAAIGAARVASCGMQQAATVKAWLDAAEQDMKRDGYAGVSASHGMLGISVRSGPHDPFLDRIIACLPECPGLTYPA